MEVLYLGFSPYQRLVPARLDLLHSHSFVAGLHYRAASTQLALLYKYEQETIIVHVLEGECHSI